MAFEGGATADNATFIANGSTTSDIVGPSEIFFFSKTTAGNAILTANGGPMEASVERFSFFKVQTAAPHGSLFSATEIWMLHVSPTKTRTPASQSARSKATGRYSLEQRDLS